MELIDLYLGYEAFTLRYFIQRCSELSATQFHQSFDIGHQTLYETIAHIISNLEVWTDLMNERKVRPPAPLSDDIDQCLERFDSAMNEFTQCVQALAEAHRLDAFYVDTLDTPPTKKSFNATILHVLTHTTVHRWEMQHILQRLGVTTLIEGDALSWYRQNHAQLPD